MTGVQTCALPISCKKKNWWKNAKRPDAKRQRNWPFGQRKTDLVGPHVFVCHVAHPFLNFSAAIEGSFLPIPYLLVLFVSSSYGRAEKRERMCRG